MFKQFEYYSPSNIKEAIKLLGKKESIILAGGTDIFVKMREGKISPKVIVDIKKIRGLNKITEDKNFVYIGALVSINELLESKIIKKYFSLMIDAAVLMGCNEVRNKATLGGNICNASPGAEFGSTLLVLDTICGIESQSKEREISLEKFYKGPGRTDLKQKEILKYFKIPKLSANDKSIYLRHSRVKGMDLAGMNLAIVIKNYKKEKDRIFKLAVGALAPTPARDNEIEKLLNGQIITKDILNKAKSIFLKKYSPRATSLRATPEFKKIMAGNFLEIAIEKLL
jgi:aerobic carbon-monoxide dehydrogenase medium subunit